MKIVSIIILSLLVLVLLVLAVYVLIGQICFNTAMSRKSIVKKRANKNLKDNIDKYMIDLEWWDDEKFETLTVTSNDGLKLYGHYLKNGTSSKTVILVHGYGGTYRETYNYARLFYKRGYNLLAVECRGHGKSEGDMVGMGWLDRLDILNWIEVLNKQNKDIKIVLFGLSMGGAAVCMALGEKLPSNVVCAISDCAFDNVYRQFSFVLSTHSHMRGKFLMNLFAGYVKRTKNFDMKAADGIKQLKKASIPIMFIHGENDTFVPTEMVYRLSEAVPEDRREVYIAKGAEHAMSYPTDPKTYEKRVDKFLSKYNM